MWPRIANLSLIFPPNTMPIYSNLGFAILGRVLEEIAGMEWENYVQQFIVERLGLTNTGDVFVLCCNSLGSFFTPDIVHKMAVGYDYNGEVDPLYYASLGWESPAGNMYSSANGTT